MDDFPNLLARDFGFRPQGKSAPMSAAKSSPDVGSLRSQPRPGWSTGISGDRSPPAYDDVFAPPPSFSKPAPVDSIFDGFNDSVSHSSHDKPVYDDDMFDGVPGVKNPVSDDFDNVFAGMSSSNRPSSASAPPYDDIFENLGRVIPDRRSVDTREVKEQGGDGFEELIPGFGGSSPQRQSEPPEREQQSAASSDNLTAEDPFVVLETNPTSAHPSPVLFPDPLEQINRPMDSGSPRKVSPASAGLFDDEELTNTSFMSKIHEDPLDTSFLETEKEQPQRSFMENFENIPPKAHTTNSSDSLNTADRNDGQNYGTSYNPYERHDMADPSPMAFVHVETADDVWLTVSEIPLFTEPTSGPPPSRPPPPVSIRQESYGKSDQFYSDGVNSKVRNSYSSSQSSQTYHHVNNLSSSPIDGLEDFVSGKPQRYANENSEVRRIDEEIETNSAAAAMKEAMDKAEAKFKHAKETRERERDAKSAKGREPERKERYEKAMADTQYPEEDEEKQDILAREQEQRERDEKEEQKRRQTEREQAERVRARQAVERATREARERASVEARLKAERLAVEKANAEARQRAERAAFQKASAEARERAAVEAREKAERERAAAEARERERAAAEAREKERVAAEAKDRERATVRERAAVERAAQEARIRAQRAAVERVTAEARERAAAEAQRRSAATAATRERQQKTEIDVESFFNFDSRPSSAPKQRNPTSQAGFEAQFQNKGFSDGLQRTTTATSSTIRKAQSTVNITDDLASIFGAPSSSGDFQEVEGETEERRRARLERHQRTLERTVKALAEKNERDMQVQRDQAERHRIAETLDFEIKRWAAGKEGNLRALLSTLHYVLWPECGWQPVSLTDLITVASVKKVYRKATLCIHPDKVQQKGATLQQKYIAEKVFDLLKEAWNKVNSEELM